jgi:hypothetical protein
MACYVISERSRNGVIIQAVREGDCRKAEHGVLLCRSKTRPQRKTHFGEGGGTISPIQEQLLRRRVCCGHPLLPGAVFSLRGWSGLVAGAVWLISQYSGIDVSKLKALQNSVESVSTESIVFKANRDITFKSGIWIFIMQSDGKLAIYEGTVAPEHLKFDTKSAHY